MYVIILSHKFRPFLLITLVHSTRVGLFHACYINFIAIGVGYFVPQDVLLSIWRLYILIKVGKVSALSYTGKSHLGSGGMFVWGNATIA